MAETFRLRHEEVSDTELQKAKAIIESDAIYQKETVQGQARKLGFFETVGGGIDWEDEYNRQVRAVTPATLMAAAQKYLTVDNATIAALVPDKKSTEPKKLEAQLTAALAARVGQVAGLLGAAGGGAVVARRGGRARQAALGRAPARQARLRRWGWWRCARCGWAGCATRTRAPTASTTCWRRWSPAAPAPAPATSWPTRSRPWPARSAASPGATPSACAPRCWRATGSAASSWSPTASSIPRSATRSWRRSGARRWRRSAPRRTTSRPRRSACSSRRCT